jgi:hypothetical protein
MSVLHFKSRPWTVFDAANKEHRLWYNQFVTHGGWGSCPYRFIVPEDHGDLITMCQRSLVRYYVAHEFNKKPRQTVLFQKRR